MTPPGIGRSMKRRSLSPMRISMQTSTISRSTTQAVCTFCEQLVYLHLPWNLCAICLLWLRRARSDLGESITMGGESTSEKSVPSADPYNHENDAAVVRDGEGAGAIVEPTHTPPEGGYGWVVRYIKPCMPLACNDLTCPVPLGCIRARMDEWLHLGRCCSA